MAALMIVDRPPFTTDHRTTRQATGGKCRVAETGIAFLGGLDYNCPMSKRLQVINQCKGEELRFPRLRAFVEHPAFGLTIVALIFVSVALILMESFAELPADQMATVMSANDVLTAIFIVELSLRWLISRTTKQFLKMFWIDILAVLPMLRVFRLGRILRLLRLFRIFSLGAVFQRRFAVFGRVLESRLIEYGIILGFTIFAVIFGAVGLVQFETGPNSDLKTPGDAFWKALFSLLAGEYADYPSSIGGRVIFVLLLLFGMGVFAMLTGTFSAIMIEKLKENAMHRNSNPEDLNNHIVICGFSSKVAILATEFLLDPVFSNSDILLVSEYADLNELRSRGVNTERITILKEDFTRMETLERAGVDRARAAIILSEAGENRPTQDIDARTLLAALTIERMNPKIHTSAEIYHEEYATHLRMGGVEDIVIQHEVSSKLLARVAMHEGLLAFFKDLLSRETGNTLVFIECPEDVIGMEFEQAMAILHLNSGVILAGIKPVHEQLMVNPRKHRIKETDELLVITPVSEG